MGWYDTFSRFYDRSLEPLYRDARISATAALDLQPNQCVLDLPCGTGLSFAGIEHHIGDGGRIVALDRSRGMLGRAAERVARHGWSNVSLIEGDVHGRELELAADLVGGAFDRVHVFLGLSAFDDWQEAFERVWSKLRPGGRCVVVDVHSPNLGLQGHMVNLIARAEIRRRHWEPFEAMSEGYRRLELPSLPQHGGTLYLSTGVKPGGGARA